MPAVLITVALAGPVRAAEGPGTGATPIVEAMEAELERSVERLGTAEYEAPYYVAYTLKERAHHNIVARAGALVDDDRHRARSAHVDVRVGDYDFDSSEDANAEWPYEDDYAPPTQVSIDDRPDAIRHAFWLLTDLHYKQATSSFLKLKGERVFRADKRRKRPSNARAAPVTRVDARRTLSLDSAAWGAVARRLSKLAAAAPHVFDSHVQIAARQETRWFVNSEGTRVRTVQPLYEVHVTAWARADDGMLLDLSVDVYSPTESGLPSPAQLEQRTTRMLADLNALRQAPELGPYTGPAILEPRATGVFFHEVLGHRLEGHRQDANQEGQTFTDHLDKIIMPEFISVLDDPTVAELAGQRLNGTYAVDDEGVAAERVVLVDRGRLKTFLMGRRPAPGFDRSNGHGRAAGVLPPVSRMSSLIVTAHKTVTRARLKSMLIAEARRQKKPFGLIIRDIAGGSTNTSSFGYQAFKGEARMVYRVDAATGREALVRGVDLVGTPLASLAKIRAAAGPTDVFNGYCGAESGMIPVSTVAPATLFREIELQRTSRGRAKAPILPRPLSTESANRSSRSLPHEP